ncbi:MAG: hypothetical protein AAB538_01300 [Patescibacteria group bacterium]
MAWSNGNNNNQSTQLGLSLLGTLLAAFLLATTAVVVSRLVARTERATQTSREFIVATAVGREGLELVRAVRDTNWFLKRSDNRHWTKGLCSNDDTGEQFSETREFTLDADTVRRLESVGDSDKSALHIASNAEWVHDITPRATPYQRLLSVDCRDKDVSILVTAKVNWRGGDRQEHEWTVSERLYDWMPQ